MMEEMFGAVEGESFGGWLYPKDVEEFDCLSMAEDVKEAQEFSRDAARDRQDGREKCHASIRGRIDLFNGHWQIPGFCGYLFIAAVKGVLVRAKSVG